MIIEDDRECIIIIHPDRQVQADITTGGVTTIEILDSLKSISAGLSQQLVNEYIELTGDKEVDNSKFEEWIVFLRGAQL